MGVRDPVGTVAATLCYFYHTALDSQHPRTGGSRPGPDGANNGGNYRHIGKNSGVWRRSRDRAATGRDTVPGHSPGVFDAHPFTPVRAGFTLVRSNVRR